MTYTIENGIVYRNDGTGICCIGNEKQYRTVSSISASSTVDYTTTTTTTTVYHWQKWSTTTNAYADDTTNTTAILGVTPTNGAATVITTSTSTDTMGKLQGRIVELQTAMALMDAAMAKEATT
jgi:hypothetical protein